MQWDAKKVADAVPVSYTVYILAQNKVAILEDAQTEG